MLTLVRTHWFSWTFTVSDGPRLVASIACRGWADRGVLTIDGTEYIAHREGRFRGDYLLDAGRTTIVRATKAGFRAVFEVKHDGERYVVARRSLLGRAFVLRKGDREIGAIVPAAFFSRRATADLPPDLPVPLRMFVLWLVIVSWRRAARAAAS